VQSGDGDEYSLKPPASTIDALKIMCQLVDESFLLLLPSPDGDGLTLRGFVNCFPNGPSTQKRLGMKVRDTHSNVPGYKEKTGLDKFLHRLEPGRFVKRVNVCTWVGFDYKFSWKTVEITDKSLDVFSNYI
jgi:hypothetical protein